MKDDSKSAIEEWEICDICKGYGGFDATRFSNGGLCSKCRGKGGRMIVKQQ